MKYFKYLILIFFIFPLYLYSQDDDEESEGGGEFEEAWGIKPEYAPKKEKHLNMMDDKGEQGLWKFYTRDGILFYEVTFKNGSRNGMCKKYYPYNGVLREEAEFFYGRKEGIYTQYSYNGEIVKEGSYKASRRDGSWIFYRSRSGEKRAEGDYFMGDKTGVWKYYNRRGQLSYKGKYFNGKRDGNWEIYDSKGAVKAVNKYVNGVLQGEKSKATKIKKPTGKGAKTTSKTNAEALNKEKGQGKTH